MKILCTELEDLDLMDADMAEKYENAIDNMQKKEKEKKLEGLSISEVIRTECNIVFDFFNEIWGEGTDKKIFGNKVNYGQCEKAFMQVIDYTKAKTEEIKKRTIKYSSSRANRR